VKDRSSTPERKAPIKPLIARARRLLNDVEALKRRLNKRFPDEFYGIAHSVEYARYVIKTLERFRDDRE
jgi:hypothetical protein